MGAELMKGNVWHKRKHKVTYPVFAEVKHDEIRCHIRVTNIDPQCMQYANVEFLSYAGNALANMEQFRDLALTMVAHSGRSEFDCGFEVNGNFNDSYRWVRSTKGLPDNLQGARTTFYLFDLPQNSNPYSIRRAAIVALAKACGIQYVHGVPCINEDEVDRAFLRYREMGFEGAMVKSGDHLYMRGKRIDGWLKMKPEDDASGVIVKINQAYASKDDPDNGIKAGDPLGRAGSVDVVLADDSKASPHGIAHDLGREMWQHPERFIGETCDFKFMERDRQGGYRHPTWGRFREATCD
jgi:hypothetical protein